MGKMFLGLDKKGWERLAGYVYDLGWQKRNPGIVLSSCVTVGGFSNENLKTKMVDEAILEAEKAVGPLAYKKPKDQKRKTCEHCGQVKYDYGKEIG